MWLSPMARTTTCDTIRLCRVDIVRRGHNALAASGPAQAIAEPIYRILCSAINYNRMTRSKAPVQSLRSDSELANGSNLFQVVAPHGGTHLGPANRSVTRVKQVFPAATSLTTAATTPRGSQIPGCRCR
jgi:hypothetical protein